MRLVWAYVCLFFHTLFYLHRAVRARRKGRTVAMFCDDCEYVAYEVDHYDL